jgi:hypothetical protein
MPLVQSPTPSDEERAIRDVLRRYHAAMVDARTDVLDALVARDFALVHITGYAQPKSEWFEVIDAGAFDYHRIDVDPRTLAIEVTGGTAVVSGRGVFDATIQGMRRPWRLQFTMQLERLAPHDGAWVVRHARYTTF